MPVDAVRSEVQTLDMNHIGLLVSVVCAIACTPILSITYAGSVRIQSGGGSFSVPVSSRKEMALETVVPQQYDFSCGSAAVATLLTYHYDHPVTEDQVFQVMFKSGDREKIKTEGFSMLDMKKYLDRLGFRSDGFRMSLKQLVKIGIPGITLINTKGYRHFVVIKGIEGGQVLVGDPVAGTTVVPRKTFEGLWNGVVLAAREHVQIAQRHFNDPVDWRVRPKAPIRLGINYTTLGISRITLPGRNEFGR